MTVACDVKNPLCGPNGASWTYGPQKCPDRWTQEEKNKALAKLDSNLTHFAEVIKRDLGVEVRDMEGAGAAGGLGAGLKAFLNAQLESGGEIVAREVGLDDQLRDADLVITGEGGTDKTTKSNKVPAVVARHAKQHPRKLPVICVSGSIEAEGYDVHEHGVDVLLGILDRPMTLEEAISEAPTLLWQIGEEIGRFLKLANRV